MTTINDESSLIESVEDAKNGISNTKYKVILACLFANCFLSSADSTMVVTLLGKISSDLDSQEHISWVATSYLLSCAAFQPLFGKLSDVFGRKSMLLLCIFCFSFGCFLCGNAQSLSILVAGRFITGIGGGGLSSLTTIAMSDLVSMRDRGLYGGYLGVFMDLGAISGGVLAGIFDEIWGWQSAFLIQVPISLLTGLAIYLWFDIPKHNEDGLTNWERFVGIDWIGSGLLVSSLLTLMLLTGTTDKDFARDSILWWFFVFYTIIGFITFYFYEDRIDHAIIPVKMLHNQTILITCINWWFMCMNFYTYVYYLPFYWSSVQNRSPFECGYLFIPSTVISSFTALFAGWYIKKTGRYRPLHVVAGLFIFFGSVIVFTASKDDGKIWESIFSLPLRFGTTSNHTIMLIAMLSSVAKEEQALVTSIQYGFKSCGSTMGVAFANALMQWKLKGALDKGFATLPTLPEGWNAEMLASAKERALEDPSYAFNGLPDIIKNTITNSYDSSCHLVYAFLVVTGLGCLLSIWKTRENTLDRV